MTIKMTTRDDQNICPHNLLSLICYKKGKEKLPVYHLLLHVALVLFPLQSECREEVPS